MLLIKAILWMFSFSAVINAIWMLLSPQHWYRNLPANVPAYGPFNVHFVRDVGLAFLGSGLALGWVAVSPLQRKNWLFAGSFFIIGHALLHAIPMITGHGPSGMLIQELIFIYIPAIFLLFICFHLRSAKNA